MAGPPARPAPQTVPLTVPGRGGGEGLAGPWPTGTPPPGHPARQSASPTRRRSPAPGTAPATAQNRLPPATARHAPATPAAGSPQPPRRPAQTGPARSAHPNGRERTPAATVIVLVMVVTAEQMAD